MNRKPPSQRWKVVALRVEPALLKRVDRVVERRQRHRDLRHEERRGPAVDREGTEEERS